MKKPVVKNKISFEDYENCLFNEGPQRRKMNIIRSYDHEVYTKTVKKVVLSHEDDRRIICCNFHINIYSSQNKCQLLN